MRGGKSVKVVSAAPLDAALVEALVGLAVNDVVDGVLRCNVALSTRGGDETAAYVVVAAGALSVWARDRLQVRRRRGCARQRALTARAQPLFRCEWSGVARIAVALQRQFVVVECRDGERLWLLTRSAALSWLVRRATSAALAG